MTFFFGTRHCPGFWVNIIFSVWIYLLSGANMAFCQNYFIGAQSGSLAYHGDLSESFFAAPGNFSGGFFIGKKLNPLLSMTLGYTTGKIQGNDQWSYAHSRVERNLNFTSSIHEVGCMAHVNLNHLVFPSFQKYNLTCQFLTGVSTFWFRPMTRFQDRWIDLHVTGTEGQFIPGFEQNKYHLQQFAIPWGFSATYLWNDSWGAGISFCHRFLFTDYLDDVSSVYIHEDEFIQSNNPLGAYLNNRMGENTDRSVDVETGQPRGDQSQRDGFYAFTFFIQYSLGK